ncbi:hypothetical protein C8J57DRAFT_1461753 [Mycena rebaudengoi]|nr:hypothetical protein C8J57DRAFT_1461753 [Mycena rebaudengoi]
MTGASTETASERIVFRAQNVQYKRTSFLEASTQKIPTSMAQRPAPWKNINTIIEGKLYLSNLVAARTKRSLAGWHLFYFMKEHQVDRDAIPAEMPQSGIHHMRIAVEDVDYADLLIHLPSACQLLTMLFGLAVSSWSTMFNAAVVAAYPKLAREQIWPNAGFQEQLVLFELCQYAPSPYNGIYRSWRNLKRGYLPPVQTFISSTFMRIQPIRLLLPSSFPIGIRVTSGRIIGFISSALLPSPQHTSARRTLHQAG